MRLTDLDASFRVIVDFDPLPHREGTFAEAHGVMFLCPKCFAANGGKVGAHNDHLLVALARRSR